MPTSTTRTPAAAPGGADLQLQVEQVIDSEAALSSSLDLTYNPPREDALQCGTVACKHGCHHSDFCSAGSTICYVAKDINNQALWGGCMSCGGTHPDGVDQINCDGT
ncbi:MAG: hypothetical protein K0V04_23895 [Deltaproteobacteria bacterium]|nr:hypothetical protein [Deltaproteobacteria bacterium]